MEMGHSVLVASRFEKYNSFIIGELSLESLYAELCEALWMSLIRHFALLPLHHIAYSAPHLPLSRFVA